MADLRAEHGYDEPLRPQFHYTCRRGWLSDVNGLVYCDGEYHLCYQHNPAGPGCDHGNMHWGHAVSTDLVYWHELPPALAPDADGPVFSGSAVRDGQVLAAFYTGARYMLPDNRSGVQCLACSNDRGRTWTRYDQNPIVEPITHYNRDPRVFRHHPTQQWIMAITLSGAAEDHRFALLSSPDLKGWSLLSELELEDACDCPDMFELPVDGDPENTRWVFWGGSSSYLVGEFDGRRFEPEGPARRAEQGTAGYAAQTWSDIPPSDGRRIQIAWLHPGSFPGMPFNQQLTFPCELTLRTFPDGVRLCRQPVREIEILRSTTYRCTDMTLAPGENPLSGLAADLLDLRLVVEPRDVDELALSIKGTPVTYHADGRHLECLGKSAAVNLEDGRLQLQALVDVTSIEIFANEGEVSMSFHILPSGKPEALELSVKGGVARVVSLEVHELKSIW